MRAHYHVHVGMRGYLPNQSFYAETRKDAEEIAKEEKRAWEEAFLSPDNGEPPKFPFAMVGSLKAGWFEGPGNLSYHYVQIVQCTDACDPDADYF